MGKKFKLREPTIAIHPSPECRRTLIAVPRDAVLEVVGEPQNSGLVEVLWDGMHLEVFMRDIESRGDSIKVAKAGA